MKKEDTAHNVVPRSSVARRIEGQARAAENPTDCISAFSVLNLPNAMWPTMFVQTTIRRMRP